MKKTLILTGLVLFAIINFILVLSVSAPKGVSIFEDKKTEVKEKIPTPKSQIPDSYILSVPYTVQAPYANWAVHEESCEEAAVYMYHHFLAGTNVEVLDQTKADQDLRAMRSWQIKSWGKEKDLNLPEVGRLAEGYFGYSYKVQEDITIEDIEKEISAGNPVLVPVMTHSLLNPHYGRQDTYHILVIKGYDKEGVVTNDAGVREGMNYRYTWDVLFGAIDAQSVKMNQGRDLLLITR